ncbi:hypothetical protein V6N12_063427 [Hibiscus sabdariffa]|uniref:Uncharacterized protein n=1 Tax=Hibiscus sabdariffa TaxID=183260 RepID=A0ABR2FBR4_9ROSI
MQLNLPPLFHLNASFLTYRSSESATIASFLSSWQCLSGECWANGTATGPLLQYEWLIGSQYKPVELAKLNTSKLIDNSEIFQNKLVDTVHFMEILSLKDSVERDTFFRKLPTLAEQLRCQIVLNKIFPLLTSALEYGSAAAPALNALLKTGSRLSVEEFYLKVLPTIVKLFASNDRAIRVALLQHIVQYGEPLSAQVVDDQVYPHIATGFSGTSAFLRELTLKSLLLLAPKLSQRNLSGSLLKYLSKLKSLQLEQILPYCWETLQATSICPGDIIRFCNNAFKHCNDHLRNTGVLGHHKKDIESRNLFPKVHGNACLESVVVMRTLDWKLHAFDVLSEYDEAKWNCYRTIAVNLLFVKTAIVSRKREELNRLRPEEPNTSSG